MKKQLLFTILFNAFVVSGVMAATNIGTPAGGFFTKIVAIMQDVIDFLEGPFGIFAGITMLAVSIWMWMSATRSEGQIGFVAKAVIGATFLINLPWVLTVLRSF